MWKVPFGTRVRVTNLKTGKSISVRIEDRGPAKRLARIIDLSKNSFTKISDPKKGVIPVEVEVIS